MENSGVREFFSAKNVFLTGATGFLGKGILEKLLRSCAEVNTVYILIRQKPGSTQNIQTRLHKLLENPVFDLLKAADNGKILKKICPIEGDIALPSLGLNLNDRKLLTSSVSVVIHSAATVKFDEYLPDSVELNVNGLRRVIELCKEMEHLKSFVHISTAFSNCDRSVIEEKVYPPPQGSEKMIEFLCQQNNRSGKMDLGNIHIDIRKSRPNTYTFTKALAEHFLTLEAGDLPVCIIRPSIVTAALREPLEGWIDNVTGPTGLFAAIGQGVCRVVMADSQKDVNLIPVDVVASLILCAAWETSLKEKNNFYSLVRQPIKVYNCCSTATNPIKIGKFPKLLENIFTDHVPFSKAIMYPAVTFTTNRLLHFLIDFLLHFIPAFFLDMICSIGPKRNLKMYRKLKRAAASVEYFNTNEWRYSTDNMTKLFNRLSEQDKQHFHFNVDEINWTEYIKLYCTGIRKYIVKDEDSSLSFAKSRVKGLRKVYLLIKMLIFIMMPLILLMLVFFILDNYVAEVACF